jgi:hypothetical protein
MDYSSEVKKRRAVEPSLSFQISRQVERYARHQETKKKEKWNNFVK